MEFAQFSILDVMKQLLFLIAACTGLVAKGQYKDTSSVDCGWSFKLRYPERAAKNNISGTVVIQMDRDEQGVLSNPRVANGIGYGCDEEAMRIVRIIMAAQNKCHLFQNRRDAKKDTVTQKVIFSKNEN
jgi:TonB family protein